MMSTVTKIYNVWGPVIAIVIDKMYSKSIPLLLVTPDDDCGAVCETLAAFEYRPMILTPQNSFLIAQWSALKERVVFVAKLGTFLSSIEYAMPASVITLTKGAAIEFSVVSDELLKGGYERVDIVENRKEFAVRGSIIDIFGESMCHPVRIETSFGAVESIREFSTEDQTAQTMLDSVRISIPSSERRLAPFYSTIPPTAAIVFFEAESYEDKLQTLSITNPVTKAYGLPSDNDEDTSLYALPLNSIKGSYFNKKDELARVSQNITTIVIFYDNDGGIDAIKHMLPVGRKVTFKKGRIWDSFRTDNAAYVNVSDLLGKQRSYTPDDAAPERRGVMDKFNLSFKEGDFVVHKYLGIGRFLGLESITTSGRLSERLVIEFQNQVKYYVPIHEADLVHRYYSCDDSPVTLTNLHTDSWLRAKLKASDDIRKFAMDLIQGDAKRALVTRTPYLNDRVSGSEFAASFEYEDTLCQFRAWKEIESDMEDQKPMDRLICGDVGFGKTELACRAAFKAVISGRQVAMICPTTVLAFQHFQTFITRMSRHAVNIELLTRFLSKSEQKMVIEGLAKGGVDIVIGTHRLLQDDVIFRDLGLIIIDEEQRFGVEHKNRLRKLKPDADILTLSATPIPRTLHMSLSGLKDISILSTPPRHRRPVKTIIAPYSPSTIKRAIQTELERDGQVFMLHNEIDRLETLTKLMDSELPEIPYSIIHGRMDSDAIEDALVGFIQKEFRVLIATTIIENGIDIPNANTLIVTDAFRYGLAQLHQIRGRIGRSKEQAYAYLLVKGHLAEGARERIRALEEFSDLGAGYRIALRDLELRGAGNLLGREQHGHVRAIGYDLYVQLLNREIKRIKEGKEEMLIDPEVSLKLDAYIPQELMQSREVRLDIYRRVFTCDNETQLDETMRYLEGLIGSLPEPVSNLILLQRIKILMRKCGVVKATEAGHKYLLEHYNHEKREIAAPAQNLLNYLNAQSRQI